MFKKIKENEKVQKIKELLQNPKTHDIVVLMFWLIFIFVVIIIARSMSGSSTNTYEPKNLNSNSFASMKSYDFKYKTKSVEINGQAYEDALIFYLNNKRYYSNDGVYLIEEKALNLVNFDLNVLKINSKMLNNLVSNISPVDYNSFKRYVVPLDRFINLYEIDTDADLSKSAFYNIIVDVYSSKNQIDKVVLDLTNYSVFKNQNDIDTVTIYYYNVNNVSDFRKSYDKILEVGR